MLGLFTQVISFYYVHFVFLIYNKCVNSQNFNGFNLSNSNWVFDLRNNCFRINWRSGKIEFQLSEDTFHKNTVVLLGV